MKRKKNSLIALSSSLIFSSLVIFSGCGSSKEFISSWQNQGIKIDGDPSEWKASFIQVPDQKINLGFKNDDKFLYLCLTTNDRTKFLPLLRSGLIVWFESENSSYKTFGIKYPLPPDPAEMPVMSEMNRRNMPDGNAPKENATNDNMEKMLHSFLQKQLEFEVLNPEKYPLTALPLTNKEGIELKLNENKGILVYELKVPLAVEGDYSFKAGAMPGEKIKIKFETENPELDRSPGGSESQTERSSRNPGGNRGGGMRGGGMQMPGGEGRSGMNAMAKSNPLNYTFELTLAKGK